MFRSLERCYGRNVEEFDLNTINVYSPSGHNEGPQHRQQSSFTIRITFNLFSFPEGLGKRRETGKGWTPASRLNLSASSMAGFQSLGTAVPPCPKGKATEQCDKRLAVSTNKTLSSILKMLIYAVQGGSAL